MKSKFSKFLEGFSSILCLFPSKNNRQINLPKFSLNHSLQNDWEKIGMDMWKACGVVESKYVKINRHKDVHEQHERRSK